MNESNVILLHVLNVMARRTRIVLDVLLRFLPLLMGSANDGLTTIGT